MYRKILECFLKDNASKDEVPSAPALAHFHISLEMNPQGAEQLQEMMNEIIFNEQPKRKEEVLSQRLKIESADSCEQIILLLRSKIDPMNQRSLISKALEFEDETISEIVKRYKTSLNTGFIETSIRILSKSKANVSDEIIAYFDEIRTPYAQAMALVLLGFRCGDENIPWLIEEYKKLKRLYPNESHCEGAYYALYEIANRFYPTGKGERK